MGEKLCWCDFFGRVEFILIDSLFALPNRDAEHPRKTVGHIPSGENSRLARFSVRDQFEAKLFAALLEKRGCFCAEKRFVPLYFPYALPALPVKRQQQERIEFLQNYSEQIRDGFSHIQKSKKGIL